MFAQNQESQTKDLLQSDAIRTMQKDIRQLKKVGVVVKEMPKAYNTIQKEKVLEHPPVGQPAKKEADEKEVLKRILEESARQRHEIGNKQVGAQGVAQGVAHDPAKNTAPQASAIPLPAAKPEEKEWLKKVPVAAKETLMATTKVEEDQRKKFMEDIEAWAGESDKN